MPTKITVTGTNAGVLDYVYAADGTKLQKKKTIAGNPTTTDYAGNFVYEDSTLKQFNHAEGYIEPDGSSYQYVYYLKDHQNNVRITFADDDSNGSVNSSEIRKERNFYPFGLEHRGYNSNSYGVENNLKTYQDQEFTEDLGLNTHEWKYRMSDPAIGRFWQVDPLAEDYVHNGVYNFSENRVIDAWELEGLEALSVAAAMENQASNNASNTKKSEKPKAKGTELTVKVSEMHKVNTGYPGQALEELITGGIQYVGSKLSGSDVSRETSENIQMGTDFVIFLFSKGKNAKAGSDVVEGLIKKKGDDVLEKGTKQNLNKATPDRPDLPSLDATGKVHGDLIKPGDLSKYSPDELKQLAKELKQSVQQRIKKTSELGRDSGHGQRQGAEQDLIKSIENHLSNIR